MADHPYSKIADYQHWMRAIARRPQEDVDPLVSVPFQMRSKDRVATIGSCFAQHIGRHLQRCGFNYFVTEALHPSIAHPGIEQRWINAFNYGTFTARYGNVYSC